ncbi:MAG: DUF1592 domain-containing protein [Pirellulaceae bacterium]|nr:DUF1592 domain-containing protein [Pirellulaceae bacterium]
MRAIAALITAVGCFCAGQVAWSDTDVKSGLDQRFAEHVRPVLSTYCHGCHSGDEPEAELNLASYDRTAVDVAENHAVWARIEEVVRSGEMPPDNEPQPSPEETKQLLGWLESALNSIDCSKISQPGRVTVRRLNRAEYDNTIRDLVGLDFKPAADFPADNVGNGFDNISQVMSLPSLLLEKYLAAAEEIVTRLLSDPTACQAVIHRWSDPARDRKANAKEVLRQFASRAFRRPIQQDELDRLMKLIELRSTAGADYVASFDLPLQAILASPHFLFRIEFDNNPDSTDQLRALNDYEFATRLSYFLWSSMPDEQLTGLAREGRLQESAVLETQVRRMLDDGKAQALVENFAGQWLELRTLAKVAPDPEKYPDFDESLRTAMRRETELFFAALMAKDRSVLELIDADYTYLNERLARHYGLDAVEGDEFREVKLTDARRGGILTHASVLTLTSNPTRTSPVKRGKWILENLLGAPPPPPPPGVEELSEEGDAELLGSLRERMEQHREDPSCAVCHRKMDALGFGFENFDGIGSWREKDGRFTIDASGELPGDLGFNGPQQLRQLLKTSQKPQFTRSLAEKMLTYALGRGLESYDRCAVDDIVENLQQNDYRFSALVLGIVNSEPFRLRGFRGGVK